MKSTTSTYKQIIASGNTRDFYVTINMTLADETTLTLTEEDIMSFKMETASSGNSSFDLGSAIIGMCKFSLENFDERYTSCEFFNATATVWVKLKGDSEYHRMGFYTVDEPEFSGAIVSLEMLDNMWKFDVPFSEVNLTFPCSCVTAVNAICTHCGVSLATNQFHGYSFTLESAPDRDMNCREFLQYVAMIGCNFCIIDDTGALRLKWYDVGSRPSDSLDGGTFSTNTTPYSDGDVADGGNFTNYYSGDDYDGGTFIDNDDVAWFTRNFNTSVGTDEIAITGVKFTLNNVDYKIGVDGYVLSLDNPLVNTGNVSAVLNLIWDVLEDFKLRTFNVKTLPDIAPEVGDCCVVKDLKGNFVYSWITNISFEIYSQTVRCDAVTPSKKLTERYSKSVQTAVDEAREKTEQAISRYDVAVQLMNNIAVNAMGGYEDYEDLPTGGRIYYLSNEPITKVNNVCTFETGSTVFKATGSGFFVSTDGGQTYVNGYDPNTGALVVNVLKAIGVSADWVETGLLRDANNSNYWNLDTGEFRLASTATVGGKTVDTIATEKAAAAEVAAEATAAANLATAVLRIDGDISNLQDQIDGNITTWFYSGVPTLSNLPASQWTTTEEKNNHLGDLYYDTDTDYAYRFMLDGSTYKWDKLSDADITAALAAAQTAQDTADHKRRVFVSTPVPPYDVGDLWSQGSTGDLKRCSTAKTASQTYDANDWVLATKYTDDAAVNALNLALDQEEVYKRLTNNDSLQGIFLENGKLYINSEYISAGTFSADFIDGGNLFFGRSEKDFLAGCFADVHTTPFNPLSRNYAARIEINYTRLQDTGVFVIMLNILSSADDISGYYNVEHTTDGGSTYTNVLSNILLRKGWNRINFKYPVTDSATEWYTLRVVNIGDNSFYGTAQIYHVHSYIDEEGMTSIAFNAIRKNLLVGTSDLIGNSANGWAGTVSFYFSPSRLGQSDATFNMEIDVTADDVSSGNIAMALYYFREYDETWVPISGAGWSYNSMSIFWSQTHGKFVINYDFSNTDARRFWLSIDRNHASGGYVQGDTTKDEYSLYIVDGRLFKLTNEACYGQYDGLFHGVFNGDVCGWYYDEESDRLTSYGSFRTADLTYTMRFKNYLGKDGFSIGSGKVTKNRFGQLTWDADSAMFVLKSGFSSNNNKGLIVTNCDTTDPLDYDSTNTDYYTIVKPAGIYVAYSGYSSKYAELRYNTLKIANDSSNYMEVEYSDISKLVNGSWVNNKWDTSSDERVKKNIKTLDEELSKRLIDESRPVKFEYINMDGVHYGMIAQEARELLDSLGEEEAVLEHSMGLSDEKTGIKDQRTINYEEYVPHLINYVKDLRAEIDGLKEEIRQLKEGK